MCGCNRAKAAASAAAAPPVKRPGGRVRVAPAAAPSSPVQNSLPTVDTSVWGAPMWTALHIASMFSQNIPLWRELITALVNDLPCPDCRAHYSAWIKRNPLRVGGLLPIQRMMQKITTSSVVVTWLLNLHNDVNSRNSVGTWSLQQLRARYDGDRGARLTEGRTSLQSIKTSIGPRAFGILERLLA